MKDYSRIDVLTLLPSILENDFAIIVDDSERSGEENTLNLMCDVLDKNRIAYHKGTYSGTKSTTVIASDKWKFLTSM